MSEAATILLLEDEPLILMDLEFAAEDRGCRALLARDCETALALLGDAELTIDLALLDVSLGGGTTCFPIAHELDRRGISYILHSGDLDRHNERIRRLDAPLIAKPSAAGYVIEQALAHAQNDATRTDRARNMAAD